MYGGQIMEKGPVDALFRDATHPYTRGLIGSIPRVDRNDDALLSIPGNPPNMARMQDGCPFAPRCDFAGEDCLDHLDPLTEFAPGRLRACNRPIAEVTGGLTEATGDM